MPQVSSIDASADGADGDPRPVATVWVCAAVVLALTLTSVAAAELGLGKTGLELALRLTARLAFVLFWPSYVAGALVVLFGRRFAAVLRRARVLGLGFAAVLAVHLGLVAALAAIGAAPSVRVFLIFGPGAICALLLALASTDAVGRMVGPAGWWALRNIGMNYLAFDFAVDFLRPQPDASLWREVQYLPFAVLTVLGPALRLLAWVKLRIGGRALRERWGRGRPNRSHLS